MHNRLKRDSPASSLPRLHRGDLSGYKNKLKQRRAPRKILQRGRQDLSRAAKRKSSEWRRVLVLVLTAVRELMVVLGRLL